MKTVTPEQVATPERARQADAGYHGRPQERQGALGADQEDEKASAPWAKGSVRGPSTNVSA